MQTNRMRLCCGIIGLAGVLCWKFAAAEDSTPDSKPPASSATAGGGAAKEEAAEAVPRVSLDVARTRAQLMHEIYAATLDTMHHRYFRGDRAVVPARAMIDVFKEMEHQNGSRSRWISASFGPMSIDHKPKTDFEKRASKKIARGEDVVETVDDGYYRRAGSIPLGGGCVGCHGGFSAIRSESAKFAGLIISIPVDQDAKLGDTKTTATP